MMRDLKKEGRAHDELVARAKSKVAKQAAIVESVQADDPRKAAAQKLLFEMQQNATAAEVNRALAGFGNSEDKL